VKLKLSMCLTCFRLATVAETNRVMLAQLADEKTPAKTTGKKKSSATVEPTKQQQQFEVSL